MGVFRIIGSLLCLLAIIFICLVSASFFNPELSDFLKETGFEVKKAVAELSEKASVNTFSEAGK